MANEISEEYAAAIAAHRTAYNVYTPICKAHRAGTISSPDYIAARDVYFEAVEVCNAAADAEANR